MPTFAFGGIACVGKTTYIKSVQECTDGRTDFAEMCGQYPAFSKKTGNAALASMYSSLIASRHASLLKRDDVVLVDRFHWEGGVFEYIFDFKKRVEANIKASLAEFVPMITMVKEIYKNDKRIGHDGVIFVNSDEEAQLKFLNRRGDHLGRIFNRRYVQIQNLVYTLLALGTGILYVDLAEVALGEVDVETLPLHVQGLLKGGVIKAMGISTRSEGNSVDHGRAMYKKMCEMKLLLIGGN